MQENFYEYQLKRMQILLAWGAVNTVVGLVGALNKHKFWRQFWLQCFGWGAIDALIAFLGRQSQAKKRQKLANNELDRATLEKDIKSFHRILLINTFLDVGYMLSGLWLRQRGKSKNRPDRQGLGAGFIVQGLYLFVFDLSLTLEVSQKWLKKP